MDKAGLEAAARAICIVKGVGPDSLHQFNVFTGDEPFDHEDNRGKRFTYAWRSQVQYAEPAIAAYLAALPSPEPVAWADVVGYEATYEVSSNGDVRNKTTQRAIARTRSGGGYQKVDLWAENSRKQARLHRVVAMAFLPNPDNKPEVNHKDGDKTNNRAENLEWCTRSENERHSRDVLGTTCKPIESIDATTGETTHYKSVEHAARELGHPSSSIIWRAVKGERPTAYGRSWRYTLPAPPSQREVIEVPPTGIRICPERDGPCPHGMECKFSGDRYNCDMVGSRAALATGGRP